MGFSSEVTIELENPVPLPESYEEKHAFLSAEARSVRVGFRGADLFTARVPKGTFNPYRGVAAQKLMEAVLTREVDVGGKRVVDLGCGSGVIGLSCVHAGAASVLFTDVNSAILGEARHPMLRASDVVKVQDLLSDEPSAAYDVIVMSTPTNRVDEGRAIAADGIESAIFRTDGFIERLLAESARCLVPGGELVLWIKVSHEGLEPYHALMMRLHAAFDLGTMRILWHSLESEIQVGRQAHDGQNSHLVFAIRTRRS